MIVYSIELCYNNSMKIKNVSKVNKLKTKKKNRFLVFILAEIATGFLAYFFSKNKDTIIQFSKKEKKEATQYFNGKLVALNFWKKTHRNLKDFFIPHEGNNHKPKSLHPKSLATYVFLALLIKLIATGALFFVYPDPASMARIVANEMIQLANSARKENNLPPLEVSQILVNSAIQKGNDMLLREYFTHDTPDGDKPWNFINKKEYDYVFAGENLAMDFTSGEMIHEAFMKSPSHRRNILDPDYKEIGVAVVSGKMFGNDTDILVMFFGTQRRELLAAEKAKKTTSPIPKNTASPVAIVSPAPAPRVAAVGKNASENIQSEGIIVLGSKDSQPNELINFIIEWMNVLFIAFILYIGMCLVLNIFVKIKVQHQSLILQSFVVISLIMALLVTKLHFIEQITQQLKIL